MNIICIIKIAVAQQQQFQLVTKTYLIIIAQTIY